MINGSSHHPYHDIVCSHHHDRAFRQIKTQDMKDAQGDQVKRKDADLQRSQPVRDYQFHEECSL